MNFSVTINNNFYKNENILYNVIVKDNTFPTQKISGARMSFIGVKACSFMGILKINAEPPPSIEGE